MKRAISLILLTLVLSIAIAPIASAGCTAWQRSKVYDPYCGGSKCGVLWLKPSEWLQKTQLKRNCPYIDEKGYSHDKWEYKYETNKLSCCN